ncbi:MAG: tetratricopeptide repeat protein [Dysgonamonadaceae bacterium]|jgi:tetratricopeptide (TPR) repeat protein|nr:tetratricopeptide repeat protein [Dysgonamonadaceae bacterium]
MKRLAIIISLLLASLAIFPSQAQINTKRMLTIGRNALYFEDYVLSIQYFNEVIKAKPYLAEPYLYRALAKLNLDDFHGAETDLTYCIDRNPFLVFAYLYRGIARQSEGEYIAAISDYNKGLEYRPEDRQMLINKGIAQIQSKDFDSAAVTFDILLKYHPKMQQAYLMRSNVHAEKGDTAMAFQDIEQSLILDRFYAPAYGQRAILLLQQERYGDAESDFNEAIRIEPRQIAYYINRGLVRFHLNNLHGAMDDYDAVITLSPENTIARFNRGLLRAQVGELSRAVEDFDVVIRNEPDNFMAIYNRAILNEETGKYPDAIRDLDMVLDEYPNFVPGYYFRSEVKRKMKDAKSADIDYWFAHDLEQKLRKEKENGKIVTGRGVFDTEQEAEIDGKEYSDGKKTRQRSDRSIEKFSRLVVYDRDDEIQSAYGNEIRGRVQDRNVKVDLQPQFVITYYEKVGNFDQTINHYNKTLQDYNARKALKMQLKTANREAPLTDGQAEYHFRSIDEYSLAVDRNPENADAYFGRALDFMVVQDLTEAIGDYSRVIEIDPSFLLAYFNRAVVRYKKIEIEIAGETDESKMTLNIRRTERKNLSGQSKQFPQNVDAMSQNTVPLPVENSNAYEFEQILRDYSACIRINPDFVYAWYNRANIRCLQKDFRAAIADYDEAINRNPLFAEAYFNRGLSRLYIGETGKGIADLSRAGELGLADAYSIIKKMNVD